MNTALYCIGTKRPSAREPETALYRIGTKRPRRRCTEKARVPETRRDARDAREPNGNPMGRLGQRRRRAERRAGRAARGASFQGVVFVCAAQEPEERSQSVWAHVLRPEILSAASAAKRKVRPCLP